MRFRRYLSYIIMVLTVVFTIGFNSQRLFQSKINTTEFSKGTQLVFALSKRDASNYDQSYYPNTANTNFLDLNEIDIEKKVMERLDSAGVRNAEVTLVNGTSDNQGYQLKVNFSPLSDTELTNVRKIISMNGSLSVVVTGDDYYFTADRNQLINTSNIAEVIYEDSNPYPAINIASSDDYDTLVEEARKAYDAHKNDTTTSTDSDSDSSSASYALKRQIALYADGDDDSTSDEDTKGQGTVYLWCNKTVADTFDLAYGKNQKYKVDSVADKVLVPLYTSDYNSSTMQWKIPTDKDGNAFNISTARAFVTMLNSSDYGFDIEYLYSNSYSIPFGNNANDVAIISFTTTLAVISVILIALFGFAGFSAALSLFATDFFALFLFIVLGFEFSVAGIVGLAVVSSLSVLFSTIYIHSVKVELKKGRRYEKANKEGFRKSVLLNLDLTVVVFLGSLLTFIIAGGMFKTILGMIMVGSLVAYLITVFLNFGLSYFLTKGVATSRLPLFGFNYSKLFSKIKFLNKKEKKAKKEIDFATCNSVKSKSFISMISTAALSILLCVITLPSFFYGSNGNSMFNNKNDYESFYTLNISYRIDTNSEDKALTSVGTNKNFIRYIKDIGLNSQFGKFLALNYGEEIPSNEYEGYPVFYFDENDCYTSLLTKNDENNLTYYVKYFSLKVDRDISTLITSDDNSVLEVINQSIRQENITLTKENEYDADVNVEIGLSNYFNSNNFLVNCFVETPIIINTSTNNLILILFLFNIFACIYTLVRYGISTCLSQLAFSTINTSLSLALLALFRLPYNAYTGFGLIATGVIVNVIAVLLLAKNKELIKERGLKGNASKEDKASCINMTFENYLPSSVSLIISSLILMLSTLFINEALIGEASIFLISVLPIIPLVIGFLLPFFYVLFTNINFQFVKDFYMNRKAKKQEKKEEKEEKLSKDIKYVDEDGPHETIIKDMNDFKF